MILYHGSDRVIEKPSLFYSRHNVDFGRGFYTTPICEQAVNWSKRFKQWGGMAIVSRYRFDESALETLKVLRFNSYSEEWLDFILNCRLGKDISDYDIVIGGVANDKVFNTLELFGDGLIEKTEALKRLRYEKTNLQFAFRSDRVLADWLHFEGSEQI